MYRLRNLVHLLLLLLLVTHAFAADTAKSQHKKPAENKKLSQAIEQILSEPDVAKGFWGIDVVSLDTGNRIYGLNENKLFTPASNTKLFTTAAALGLIGPDYRFKTTVESVGTVIPTSRGEPCPTTCTRSAGRCPSRC